MSGLSRRDFLSGVAPGLAALGAGALALRAGAQVTEPSGGAGSYGKYLQEKGDTPAPPAAGWAPTEKNILGPFHREGAPYRAKITPPLEAGTVLLIRGRVWSFETRKPLAGAVLDVWQANAKGRYDNDDPGKPPAKGVYLNRARLITDEEGAYEFETVHPGRYEIGPGVWRPSHIHYGVRHPGHRALVTQLYFRGDPMNDRDSFIRPSLIIGLEERKTDGGTYEAGTFDIVLARE